MNRTTKSAYLDQDDGFSPYTTTPTQWAATYNIPSLRIRHPLNTTNIQGNNKSVQQDFLIAPYQYGMAIEYNGVVECWVGEWSIHKGVKYYDTEGQGNGWGAVLWVGDDVDRGGIRATARNNTLSGGNVAYGELAVEKFHNGGSNGDLRLRLPSIQNQFHFVYGEKGSTNIVAKISDKGFFLPVVSSSAVITIAEKGQIYFDSTAAEFKGYDGNEWVSLSNRIITDSRVLSSDGTSTFYQIPHGLGTIPSYFNVIATSAAAGEINYVTADDTYLKIFYRSAPAAGTNNLSWNWQIKK
jgi:hypothetical protein